MKGFSILSILFYLGAFTYSSLLFSCVYEDVDMIAAQTACDAKGSTSNWSCEVNRCVTKESSVVRRKEYKSCTSSSGTAAEKEACYKRFAESENKKAGVKTISEEEMDKEDMTAAVINAAFAGIMGLSIVASGQGKNSCMSGKIAAGAGVLGLLTYGYLRFMAKDQLKELREDYKTSATSGLDSYQAQINVFEYLKREQEAIVDYATTRRNSYYLIAAGYGAAVIMAIMDQFKNGGKCIKGKSKKPQPAPDGLEQGDVVKAKVAFTGFFSNPIGIGIISGLGAAWSLKLAFAADEQIKEAKSNIEKIEQVIATFRDSVSGFCASGRDDISQPRCYCYTESNGKNENRSNSATCQKLWDQDEKNYFAGANDYRYNQKVAPVGCLRVDGKFDEKCDCKKLVNSKGENACKKTIISNANIQSLDKGIGITSFSNQVNDLTNGNTSLASLNQTEISQKVARNQKIKKEFLKKLNAENKKKNIKKSLTKEFTPRTRGLLTKQLVSKDLAAKLSKSTVSLEAERPAEKAFLEAVEKAKFKRKKISFSKSDGRNKNNNNNDEYNFAFNESAKNAPKVETYMEKKYDFKANDIVERRDLSIWKVISNRYSSSALKRLFGDEKKAFE